jgi:hypothetical protein
MKKLDKKILDIVESKIKTNGLENTLDKVYVLLQECKRRKEYALKRNIPLYNTDSQIQCCHDIIDYLTEKLIEKNIKKILVQSK